ncbi:hypothetical protein WICPIJ_003905 [Wickerhamomyces pijperi]|uniref:TOG domain-containing protein n=1 Tax=Wickerhamomyces pijperi TaxID=599730 RepID=A0A9P8Q6Q7_WICPI|nr:hypothetical protein WICPIJ_003905 [Wickerhamomyces pijperi]
MAEEPDYSTLPLEDRLVHKLWKARLEAYQEITNSFQKTPNEQSEVFRPYLSQPDIFKKIVTDSNVVAQEAGIAALNALLEFAGTNAAVRLRSAVIPALCEKGLSSARANTKQKTIDCLLWFVDLDTPDPVIELMVPSLSAKLPKLVSGTVKALVDIYSNFGAKVVSPKLVLPSLPKLFSHADRTVRAETSNLTVELFKWMGPSLEQILFAELKPVQQKDLTTAFDKVKDIKPTQIRFLKSQRDAMEQEQASGDNADAGDNGDGDVVMGDSDEPQNMDPYDLMDPVDVLSKIPEDLSAKVSVTKWKERVEALTEVDEILKKVIKLADADYTDLVRTLAKCIKDVNVQVVTLAANCIEYISKGLRERFHKYYTIVLNPLLERLKEKKQSVLDSLNGALDATFQSSSLSDILEETLVALKHKTPQVRLASSQFLVRCLRETTVAPKRPEVESIITTAIKLAGDTLADVRNNAFQIIGTLMKITGERELNSYLESVDDIKKKKIQEAFESAEVKAKTSAPKPKPLPAPNSKLAAKPTGTIRSSTGGASSDAAKRKSITRPTATTSATATATSNSISGLKKKLPPQSSIPSKRPPTSPLKTETLPRNTLLSGRGLTGRQLQSVPATQSAPQPPQQQQQSVYDRGLSDAERQELEDLRREKYKWQQEREEVNWKLNDSMHERTKLMDQVRMLETKVEKMSLQYTEGAVSMKSLETKLQRSQSDLEISRLKISQLESEIQLLKKQRTSALSQSDLEISRLKISQLESEIQLLKKQRTSALYSSSFSQSGAYDTSSRFAPLQESNSLRPSETYPSEPSNINSASSLDSLDQRVGTLTIDPEQKENTGTEYQSNVFSNSTNGYNSTRLSTKLDTNDESWKRAALVTSQLKARIEEMKAKNRMSRTNFSRGEY